MLGTREWGLLRSGTGRGGLLIRFGVSGAAEALQLESGFELETRAITEFRSGVLEGNWASVEKLLLELPPDEISNLPVREMLLFLLF